MLSLPILLHAVLTSSVLAGQFSFHGSELPPESCSWTPLLRDKLSCGRFGTINTGPGTVISANATAGPGRSGDGAKGTGDADDIENRWTGPHFCVGVYCVFANPSFAHGRGIVLVTTAHIAQTIAHLPVFSSAEKTTHGPVTTSHLFRVEEIPGKGLGLVATQPIRRGQQIMAHTPVILAHPDLVTKVTKEEQGHLLDAAVAQLPPPTRQLYLAQMGYAGGHRVTDIMHTNSFGTNLHVAGQSRHFANWPEVSRFNHDCRPNVVFYVSPLLQHVTHAARDIAIGEELTLSYLDSLKTRAVRQDRAVRNWGFQCTCPHCSLPSALANASDFRLGEIYDTETILSDWNSGPGPPETADRVDLLLSLYEQERLVDSHSAKAFVLAALNYNALGREIKGRHFALRGLEQAILQSGPWSDDVAAMLAILGDPKGHWSWLMRVPGEANEGNDVIGYIRALLKFLR